VDDSARARHPLVTRDDEKAIAAGPADCFVFRERQPEDLAALWLAALAEERHWALEIELARTFLDPLVGITEGGFVRGDPLGRAFVHSVVFAQSWTEETHGFTARPSRKTPPVEDRPEQRLLCAARDLVARSWSRGADARDEGGAPVKPWDERAASWSLLGALVAVLERGAAGSGDMPLEHLAAALYALSELIEDDSLAQWNDAPARTQAAVVSVLDRAAEACENPRHFTVTAL
jgi:hypothetical protein